MLALTTSLTIIHQDLGLIAKIAQLQPLFSNSSLTQNQLWQGICFTFDHASFPILIKYLEPQFSQANLINLQNEFQTLKVCKSLALKPASAKKIGIPTLYFSNFDHKIKIIDSRHRQIFSSPILGISYHNGLTLKQIIAKNNWRFSQKISLFRQMCQLLIQFHHLGYLHRDIKPDNFIVTPTRQLVLIDFGLTLPLQLCSSATKLTAGTPAYMSPEQFTGQRLSLQSDYYSLGIIFYELLTGKKPFYTTNIAAWATMHCQQPVPLLTPSSSLTINQVQDCQPILDSLMAKLTENRIKHLYQLIPKLTALIRSNL